MKKTIIKIQVVQYLSSPQTGYNEIARLWAQTTGQQPRYRLLQEFEKLPSSAQSEAQLKLSLSSIYAASPPPGIRHPPSGIRHPEKYNFQSYNSPSYNPSDSASTQQPAAPAKTHLWLYFQLFPNLTTTTTSTTTSPTYTQESLQGSGAGPCQQILSSS